MGIIYRLTSNIGKYPFLLLFGIFVVWAGVSLLVPVEYKRDILAPQGEGDRAYFGGNTVVSQEFIPHSGISELNIPLGSTINPNGPLILHLRETHDSEDILTVPPFSFSEEVASFHFAPIWLAPEKLVWIIEAPHAPAKSFWTYREQDPNAFTEGRAYQNKRILRGNMGFTEVWRYPRAAEFLTRISVSSSVFAPWEYASVIAGVIGFALYMIVKRFSVQERLLVWIFIMVGAGLHVWLGLTTPVIIDEGAYIQDVLQSSLDLLPFRDFLTKGPLYLFILWLWSFIAPNTVIAWRLFSAIFWIAGGWFFWKLLIELNLRKRSRLLAVFAFSLIPAVVALTTPLLLQTASVAISMLGLLFALRAAKRASLQLAALAAIVFAFAFFVRVTVAIPALVAFCFYFLFADRGIKIKLAAVYVGVGLVLFGLIFAGALTTTGLPKAAIFTNMEAFLISQNRQEVIRADAPDDPIIRMIIIEARLLWGAGVLLLAPILVFPAMFIYKSRLVQAMVIIVGILLTASTIAFHLHDTNFLLPKTLYSTIFLTVSLFFVVPFITAVAALLYGEKGAIKKYWNQWQTPLLVFVWLGMTVLAYSQWGRFRQSYITEFIPQLAIIFGVGFDFVLGLWKKIEPKWLSRSFVGLLVIMGSMSVYQGYAIAQLYPHTGTISQASLVKIVGLISRNVPRREMIFTAQPVATAFSNRPIIFGYAHPGWYREARFGTISESLRDLLFKKPEAITEYLRNEANFVLTESRTNEIYFDGYPERVEILQKNFTVIESLQNETVGDTYTLYKRN